MTEPDLTPPYWTKLGYPAQSEARRRVAALSANLTRAAAQSVLIAYCLGRLEAKGRSLEVAIQTIIDAKQFDPQIITAATSRMAQDPLLRLVHAQGYHAQQIEQSDNPSDAFRYAYENTSNPVLSLIERCLPFVGPEPTPAPTPAQPSAAATSAVAGSPPAGPR
jgi:hypothetical protein